MSKLLKSKFLLGVMIVAVMLVGVVAVSATKASAADCSITTTLRVGSKGSQVACLQNGLGLTADGSFGPKTKAGVVAWQKAAGLVADGIFGAKSRAAWTGGSVVVNPGNGCQPGWTVNPFTGASCTTGVIPPTQTGPVTVSLAQDNPAAGTIIAGQAGADLAHFTFSGNGTVNSVTLTRGGVSDANTLSNVYLYDGTTRITDGYTFNNTGMLTMNNVNLVVNGSRTIAVKADVLSTTPSYSVSVAISSLTVGTTVSPVSVKGNEMYLATGTGVLATANLTTTSPSPAATPINAGSLNQTLWSNSLSIGLHATKLAGMIVKQIGSASSNALSNVALYVDGSSVATATINANNQFVFSLATPLALTTGSHFVEVRGDVVGGAFRNLYLSLEKSSDLVILDPQTSNVGVSVTYQTAALSNVNGGLVTINNGTLTINQDPAFSNTTTLVGGATTTKLAAWKFTAYGEDVKVNSLSFTPTFTALSTGTTLANVGLYVNHGQVGSNATATTAVALPFSNLGSNLLVPVGNPTIVELWGDVVSSNGTALTSGTVKFDLAAGTNNAQGQSSSQLTSTSGSGGQTLTIGNNVSFGATAGFSTSTKAPNTQGVKIGSFSLSAGSAEGLTVTNISVTLPVGTAATFTSNAAGTVATQVTPGSGYTSAPIVTVSGGTCTTLPTAVATIGGGAVTSIALSGAVGCTVAPILTIKEPLNSMQPSNQLSNLTVKNGSMVIGTPIGNPVITTSNSFSTTSSVAQGTAMVFDVYADFGSSSAGLTVTPSMAITYRGTSSNLSTTTATAPGSTTTSNVAVIALGNVKVNTGLSLSSRNVVTSNNFQIATYNFKSNGVAGAVIKDVTFTFPANTVTSITAKATAANGMGTDKTQGSISGTTATIYNVGAVVPATTDGVDVPITVGLVCTGTANGCSANSPVTVNLLASTVTYNDGSVVQSITPTAGPATTVSHYVFASVPSFAVDTVQKTGLTLGTENKIGEVTVSADSAGQIKVNNVAFNIATSGITAPVFSGARIAEGSTTVSGSSVSSGCTAVGACVMTFGTSPNGLAIGAGTSKTLSLYATVAGTPIASTVLTVSSSVTAGTTTWDDSIGGGTNNTAANTFNFPTGSYSIRQ